MRILQLILQLNIIQLDIQELVDGFEGAFDRDVVLELDGHFMVDEGLEEARDNNVSTVQGTTRVKLDWSKQNATYLKNNIALLLRRLYT